jgi:hypothetical protein
MELSTAMSLFTDHASDVPTNSYGWDFYSTRLRKLRTEVSEKATELVAEAQGFRSAYKKLLETERGLATEMTAEGIRFRSIVNEYEEANIKLSDDAVKSAEKLGKTLST